jgi:type VI secretion system protein ImpH
MEDMGSYGWRDGRSVTDGLFEEGHQFSFVQAVRLLEEMALREHGDDHNARTSPGEGTHPEREVVHFRHAVRMDFPPNDVEAVKQPSAGRPAEMTVNVLGLAGGLGPLPVPVSELIVERAFRKDYGLRDFLDIFNHRLVSLLYRERKKFRPALDPKGPGRSRVASVLFAFLGLAAPQLRGRMKMDDRSLLPYAGLLLDRHRSVVGLVRLIEDYFGLGTGGGAAGERERRRTPRQPAVTIKQFQGRWSTIEKEDLTHIGETGRNQILGRGAVLARRVWDQQAAIEIRLGPLTLDQYMAFLPVGRSYEALFDAVRFYLREELGFSVRLQLVAGEVPELRLGKAEPVFLGWTTWLKTRAFEDDARVRLKGRA